MSKLSDFLIEISVYFPEIDAYQMSALEEGFTNQVFLLSQNDLPTLILRLADIDEEAFYINRQAELQVMGEAASLGLSPELIWQSGPVVVTRFVPQASLDWQVNHSHQDIERIAKRLKQAHQLSLISHEYQVEQVIALYVARIKALTVEPALKAEAAYLQVLLNQLDIQPSGLPAVLCHNDLNPKNVLMDKQRTWLIDWEYTGVGDPLFDLAVVVKSHNLTRRQTIILLDAYQLTLPQQQALDCLDRYCRAYALREMAWLLLKYLLNPTDTLSLDYYFEFKGTPSLNPFMTPLNGAQK